MSSLSITFVPKCLSLFSSQLDRLFVQIDYWREMAKESTQQKVTLLAAKFTLNQECVWKESILRLRRSRRATKDNTSKKIDEITCHNCCLWKRLSLRFTNSPKLFFPFGSAHASYHDLQCDENDIQDSLDYYDGECKRIEAWSEYYENVDNAAQPEDSVSNVGSRCRFWSTVSHASSHKSLSSSSFSPSAELIANPVIPFRPTTLKEDILRLTTIKESICLKDGHYERAFPLSDDALRFPSDRTLAPLKVVAQKIA